MSELHPAHDDEACIRCHDPIHTWYATLPDGICELVVCVPCYLLAQETL